MKNLKSLIFSGFFLCFTTLAYAQGEADAQGCKDHLMFNRMPKFYIVSCEEKKSGAHDFFTGNYKLEDSSPINERIEGNFFSIRYMVTSANKNSSGTSALEIFRNFENVLKKAGAKIINSEYNAGGGTSLVATLIKEKIETWFDLNECSPGKYGFVVIQRPFEEPVIQANDIVDALNKDGHIALNILFDTGKATIKPESKSIVDEIFNLLNNNTTIKVSIEGHTDNVGDAVANKKLSEARAKAVMDAMILRGINKERLSFVGWGQEKPVADNSTDEGKTKNRRVEIVKK